MSASRVIIVTGANRGIGRAICQKILARPDLGRVKLFAASRKGVRFDHDGEHEVHFPKLDVADQESIRDFRNTIKQHTDDVSILINNAGVNLDAEYGVESVKRTLDVNLWGTVKMCETFIPDLERSNGGRIVNLSSIASSLQFYGPEVQERLRDAKKLQDLEDLAREYEHSVHSKTEEASGFGTPVRSYAFSKALVRSYTQLLARSHPDLLINCCCPGWIATDMGALVGSGRVKAPKTAEEGARIPVRLALDDDFDNVTGKYFANDSLRSKEGGKVQEW